MNGGPEIVTLGCRLNGFESELVRHAARDASPRPTVIVNTCAVTGEAERQARQTVRRLRRDRPEARIVVTGCAAQLHPEVFAAMPEVDRVLGNTEKLDPAAYADTAEDMAVADLMSAPPGLDPPPLDAYAGRSRATVQVQQGCDHRCTFCIVPFTRGPARDLPADRAVDQVRRLVAAGHREVVLSGIDLSSYGGGVGRLAARLLREVPDLPRLRLSTLDPAAADPDLFALLAGEPRLMPHLHLSLQSGDDLVLKRMKRRHSVADAEAFVARARAARPDLTLGADLIAGFPTETDRMAEATEATVRRLDPTWLHVFPYSPRPGTPAARMPQVPGPIRRARAARLRAIGEAALDRHLERKAGRVETLLAEEPRRGRCADYTPATLARDARPGDLVRVRLRCASDGLIGDPDV